jgi:carboxypeptidase Q
MTSRRVRICGIVLFGAAGMALLASARPSAQAKLSPLPAYSATKAFAHMEQLVGRIGPRITGSEAEGRAADYIAAQFKSWGLETQIQKFPMPLWQQTSARFWAEGDQVVDFPAKAIIYGGLTPPEGITGDFVDVHNASPHYLEGKDLKGKIVLVRRNVQADYPDYWLTDRLIPLGVAGMVFYSGPSHPGGMPTAYYNYKRSLKEQTPPSVDITYEDAVRLVLMKPRRVGLVATGTIEWKEARTVIADIKGGEKPDEVVIVCAHNDSAYSSPGATDDEGGVAIVMELARAFAAGPKPARTLRFIAWGGHEPGLMGSEAYLRARPDETSKIVAVVNFDGMGSVLGTIGYSAAGADDWISFLRTTLKPAGFEERASIGSGGVDATNFAALEVPAMTFSSGGAGGGHTPMDNLQFCAPSGLEEGLLESAMVVQRAGFDTSLRFAHQFPPALLKQVRDYAARWGWGVRPEANQPPNQAVK